MVGYAKGARVEVDPEKKNKVADRGGGGDGYVGWGLAWGRGVVDSERGVAFGFTVLGLGLLEASR